MRVIAGKMRGTKLESPKDRSVRPTTDRVKEDIFNILTPYIPGCLFLDLFAGSGAMGIEAVSRGGEKSVMVDRSGRSVSLIRRNVEKTRCTESVEIERKSAEAYLRDSRECFDVIFLDPPYRFEKLKNIVDNILKYDILKHDGILVVEHDKNIPIEINERLKKVREKTYSLSQVEFFVLEDIN